jgi:hypothetical protein
VPVSEFPAILERLRGAPDSAQEVNAGVLEDVLGDCIDGKWSAKEHLGHLIDLDKLDQTRLREFLTFSPVLSAADTRNITTKEAKYGCYPVREIVRKLRIGRSALVAKLERIPDASLEITALHTRLQKQLRLVDWAWFVAEHNDHHLAAAQRATQEALARRDR